jgi:hypothetical protein
MNRHAGTLLLALSGLIVGAGLTMGQEPIPMPIKSKPAPPLGVGDNDGSKLHSDPTTPSDKLREIMAVSKTTGKEPVWPSVILRGRVIAKDQPGVAVLEIAGKSYVVGKGNLIPGGVYRVKDVTSQEVTLEIVPLKENLILR